MNTSETDDLWVELKRRIHEGRQRPSVFQGDDAAKRIGRREHGSRHGPHDRGPDTERFGDLAKSIEALARRMETIERLVVSDARELTSPPSR